MAVSLLQLRTLGRTGSSISASSKKLPLAEDASPPPRTPDGRYIIVRGRLWRASNPALSDEERETFVRELMDARRAVGAAKRADDRQAERVARERVQAAKVALGERGPVWWSDGAPDQNRKMIWNSSYADWWSASGQGSEV